MNEQLEKTEAMEAQYKKDTAEEKMVETMTLDELTSHIFSLEEGIKSNVYDKHQSVDIKDPDALVEDIEEILSAVLEISMRELYSRKIYPNFDIDSMNAIIEYRKNELNKFEDGTFDFGDIANHIFKLKLKNEIEVRSDIGHMEIPISKRAGC